MMFNISGQQIMMVIAIWWWQDIGRDAASKQKIHRFDKERLSQEIKFAAKEQYHVKISSRFAALENINAEVDINRG
jgi:hypothetical protein